jgi:hypothetical protein
MSEVAKRWAEFRKSIDAEIKSKLKMKRMIEREAKKLNERKRTISKYERVKIYKHQR